MKPKKGKGDLSPKKRKVEYKDHTEKAVIGLMKDVNEGRRDYVEIRDKSPKVVADKYQDGSKGIKAQTLQNNIDHHRRVKNNKNTPDRRYMFDVNQRKWLQGMITRDSTELSNIGVKVKSTKKFEKGGTVGKDKYYYDEVDEESGEIVKGNRLKKNFLGASIPVSKKKQAKYEAEKNSAKIGKLDDSLKSSDIDVTKTKIKHDDLFVGPPEVETKVDYNPGPGKVNLPKIRTVEQEKVAAWQSKRGLKADGVWGKDTKAAYEKEQASKKKTISVGKPTSIDSKKNSEFKDSKSWYPSSATQGKTVVKSTPKKTETKKEDTTPRYGNLVPKNRPTKVLNTYGGITKSGKTTQYTKSESKPKVAKNEKGFWQTMNDEMKDINKRGAEKDKKTLAKRDMTSKSPLTRIDEAIMGDKHQRDSKTGKLVLKKKN